VGLNSFCPSLFNVHERCTRDHHSGFGGRKAERTTLAFVIPSVAESWAQGDENAFYPATALHGSTALPFVIPSVAEGSAVPRTIPGNVFRQVYVIPSA